MRISGWCLAVVLVAVPAQAEWRLDASGSAGAFFASTRFAPMAEGAIGVSLGDRGWAGVLRAAAVISVGRELGAMLVGAEFLLRHRFGDEGDEGARPWGAVGAGVFLGPTIVTDMVMGGPFLRLSLEGGVALPLAEHRWLELGLALRSYTDGGYGLGLGSAALVIGSAW